MMPAKQFAGILFLSGISCLVSGCPVMCSRHLRLSYSNRISSSGQRNLLVRNRNKAYNRVLLVKAVSATNGYEQKNILYSYK